MNGYKTGGDWTDVTSIGRNEIVFEGRHKDYGAFYIRQRYPNALLLALLSAITFVGLCAFIPYVRGIVHPTSPSKPDVIANPREIIIPPRVIVPPPVSHPVIHPPKGPAIPQFAPPVITNQPIDSAPPIPDNHNGKESVQPGGNIDNSPDMNPTPPIGNPLPPIVDNTPLTWVSEMPKFPGGKIEDYLAQNIQYPSEEIKLDVQGTVYVSFIIEKDGSASNIKVVRGISNGDDLNREAVRVLSGMPKWIPGKQNGHPVRIQYVLPIHFKLQ